MAKKNLLGKSPGLPEQYLEDKSKEFKRWVESYAFWRAEYTARNPEYLNLQKIKSDARVRFFELSESVTLTEEQVKRCFIENGQTYPRRFSAPWREKIISEGFADIVDLAEHSGSAADFYFDNVDIDWPYKILWGPYKIEWFDFLSEEMKTLASLYRKTSRECIAKFPFRGKKSSIESIIDSYTSKEQKFPPYVPDGLDANCVNITEKQNNTEYEDDMTLCVKIDYTKDFGVIFDDLYNIIAKKKSKNTYWPAESGYVTYEARAREFRSRPGVGYYTGSNASRILGLWLYDLVTNGVGTEEGKRIIENVFSAWPDSTRFRFMGSRENIDWDKINSQTKKCIGLAEVLPIHPKKTAPKPRERKKRLF